jgi:hypothetical protein
LVAAATSSFLMMAPGLARAAPLDEALTIQPIDVCDPSSGVCATANLAQIQDVLNLVWAQAGIAPVLLDPQPLMMPMPTGGTGPTEVGLTTGADNTIPVDGFRLLARTPNNEQSSNPNTINLYIVDTLSPFLNGLPQSGQIVRGISFINGNGITIGNDAVLDTAAHELGHVLALDHVTPGNNSNDPNNLMTGQPQGTRNIPTDISQIAVPGGTDQLSQDQINRARQPLFTVGLGRVTSTPLSGESCPADDTCFHILFAPDPSVSEALNSIVFKYQNDGNLPDDVNFINPIGIDPSTITHTFTQAGTVLTVNFAPGTFGQGDSIDFDTFFSEILDGPSNPISVIFNFRDGFSSQAGFDAITGADSGFGSFSFIGTPNYYVPGTCPNDSCFFGPPPAFGEIVDFDPVPEPSSLAMLGAGLASLWLVRRRRSRPTERIVVRSDQATDSPADASKPRKSRNSEG